MGLGGRPQAHLMLAVLAIEGIVHEIRIGQDLGVMDVDMIAYMRLLLLVLDDIRRHVRWVSLRCLRVTLTARGIDEEWQEIRGRK